MRRRWDRRLQYAAACAAIAVYAALSHFSNAGSGGRDLGTAPALAPIAAVAIVLAWRTASPAVAALVCAGGLLATLRVYLAAGHQDPV